MVRDARGRFKGRSGGYNLVEFDEWTPQMRRKVRDYFARVEKLEGQAKLIVRPHGKGAKAKLERLHEAFHGEVPSQDFKVAFIPYHEPKVTLPGAKQRKPRVRITRDGVIIQTKQYERVLIPFNQKALVRDPPHEIQRAASLMPGARIYFAQVGEAQSITGMSLGILTRQVIQWMEQYDGVNPLPRSSGNRGDDPKYHNWRNWLKGLVGYVTERGMTTRKMMQRISEGRMANREQNRIRRNLMRREQLEAQPKKGRRYLRGGEFTIK